MNINYKETQYNFFDSSAASSSDPRGPRVLAAQLTLSIENLVIFAIVSIMVLLFCFSLGVERGKRVAFSAGQDPTVAIQQDAQAQAVKPGTSDADDVIDSGDAQKNVFASFLPARSSKTHPAQTAEPVASVKGNPEPDSMPEPVAAVQDKPAKTVASGSVSPARKASANGSYTVQVASYKSEKIAKKEAKNLKQKGYREVFVLPKGSFVIVCIGNFQSKSDANSLTRQLKNRYQDPVVRRL